MLASACTEYMCTRLATTMPVVVRPMPICAGSGGAGRQAAA